MLPNFIFNFFLIFFPSFPKQTILEITLAIVFVKVNEIVCQTYRIKIKIFILNNHYKKCRSKFITQFTDNGEFSFVKIRLNLSAPQLHIFP